VSDSSAQPSAEAFSFVDAELEVLDFWARERIFERSLEQPRDGAPYIFYDGPPFATGLPHHGHLVASTIKDIIPLYNIQASVKTDRNIKSVRLAQLGKPLPFEVDSGRVDFVVPEIRGHQMIELAY